MEAKMGRCLEFHLSEVYSRQWLLDVDCVLFIYVDVGGPHLAMILLCGVEKSVKYNPFVLCKCQGGGGGSPADICHATPPSWQPIALPPRPAKAHSSHPHQRPPSFQSKSLLEDKPSIRGLQARRWTVLCSAVTVREACCSRATGWLLRFWLFDGEWYW